jgi:tRNA(Ile)-lysidine synthase
MGENDVLDRIQAHLELLPRPRRVLVAVSGGADSVCLLHALHSVFESSDLLVAGHVDHGLRPESAAELAVVEALCHDMGVRLVSRHVDTRALMEQKGLSLESAARTARYSALRDMAHEVGAQYIALGHTADDQVETVLMHALRGTGLTGLAGMRVLRDNLFRPLLTTYHREVEAYCVAHQLPIVHDPSNEDLTFTRNRVRHLLLPAIETVFPGARQALLRLARVAARDSDYLDTLAEDALALATEGDSVNPALWRALPEALRYHVLQHWVKRIGLEDVDMFALDQMANALETGSDPREMVVSRKSQGVIRPSRAAVDAAMVAANLLGEARSFHVPGQLVLPVGVLYAVLLPADKEMRRRALVAARWQAYLDATVVGRDLVVRTRRSGDRLRPLGAPGTRRLQDVLVDQHVPQAMRDWLPVIEANGQIVWVAGVTIAHWARITDVTTQILHLSFRSSLVECKRFGFPPGPVLFCSPSESYANIAEQVLPEVLIEDDCESIGEKQR